MSKINLGPIFVIRNNSSILLEYSGIYPTANLHKLSKRDLALFPFPKKVVRGGINALHIQHLCYYDTPKEHPRDSKHWSLWLYMHYYAYLNCS